MKSRKRRLVLLRTPFYVVIKKIVWKIIVFSFQFYDENIEAFRLIEICPDGHPSSTSQVQREKEHLNKGKLLLSEYSLFIVREKFCVMSKGNTLMKCGMLNWKFLSNWDIFLKVCGILLHLHLKKYIYCINVNIWHLIFVIDHLEVCYLGIFQNFLVVLMFYLLGVEWLDLSKLQRSKLGLQTWFVNTL